MGAALAFYAMLSFAPLLVLMLAGLGMIFGQETAQGQVVGQMRELIGKQGAEALQSMVANALETSRRATIGMWLGILMLFVGSILTFAELQDMLNRIWRVERRQYRHVWHMLQRRIFSFGLVLGFGFLLLVSLLISAVLAAAREHLAGAIPGAEVVLHTVHFLVSLAVVTILFGLMFYFVPDANVPWRDVWVGAFLTGSLFSLGKFLFGFYLGHSFLTSIYGAAGSFVVLLLWVYFSAQLMFFGAEFTHAYTRHHLSPEQPPVGRMLDREE